MTKKSSAGERGKGIKRGRNSLVRGKQLLKGLPVYFQIARPAKGINVGAETARPCHFPARLPPTEKVTMSSRLYVPHMFTDPTTRDIRGVPLSRFTIMDRWSFGRREISENQDDPFLAVSRTTFLFSYLPNNRQVLRSEMPSVSPWSITASTSTLTSIGFPPDISPLPCPRKTSLILGGLLSPSNHDGLREYNRHSS